MTRRKNLKGIASGVLGSFVSRNNDVDGYWGMGMLCLLAQNIGTSSIKIDLVGGNNKSVCSPIVSYIEKHYSALLQDMLAKTEMDSSWVQRAVATIEFGTSCDLPEPPVYTWGNPFICTVSIIDDHGRTWSVSKAGRCGPHDPQRELRSARAHSF